MNLKTKHIFKVVKILKKTGVIEDAKNIFKKQDTKGMSEAEIGALQESLGMDIVMSVVGGLDSAEKEIYELLADLEGKKPKDIEEQDLNVTIESIKEIMQNQALLGFLESATK